MFFRNFQGHLCRVAREVMQLGVLWIALGRKYRRSRTSWLVNESTAGKTCRARSNRISRTVSAVSAPQPAPVSNWASTQLTGNKQCLARTSEKEPSPSVFPEVTLKRPATTSPLFSNILELILSCAC